MFYVPPEIPRLEAGMFKGAELNPALLMAHDENIGLAVILAGNKHGSPIILP